MFAWIPVVLLAATAAAVPQKTEKLLSRDVMAKMSYKDAKNYCGNDNYITCCQNNDEECFNVENEYGYNDNRLLKNFCTAKVYCCNNEIDFPKGTKNFGDVYNFCYPVGEY